MDNNEMNLSIQGAGPAQAGGAVPPQAGGPIAPGNGQAPQGTQGEPAAEGGKEENKSMRTFLKVLLWVAIIAVVVFVVLFLSARIADDLITIPNLIQYLIDEYNGLHGLALPLLLG